MMPENGSELQKTGGRRTAMFILMFVLSMRKYRLCLVIAYLLVSIPYAANVGAMESSNFRIEEDSLNAGGTETTQSENWRLSDTAMETAGSGNIQDGTFEIRAGYRGYIGAGSVSPPGPTPAPTPAITPVPQVGGGAILPNAVAAAFNAWVEFSGVGDTWARFLWTGTVENTAVLYYGASADSLTETFALTDYALSHVFALSNLAPKTSYAFKIISRDRYGAELKTTTFLFATAADMTPPANVRSFSALPGDRSMALSWRNPSDSDFSGVRIRRSSVRYPKSPLEGDPVYDGRGETVNDKNINNGVTYYYVAFAYDALGNFSSGALAKSMPLAKPTPITSSVPVPSSAPVSTPATSPTQTPVPTSTPIPSPIPLYPSPSPTPISKMHVEIGDFAFSIKTAEGYSERMPLQHGLDAVISQNLAVSIAKETFARTVDEIILTFDDAFYFLSPNRNTGRYEAVITMPPVKGTRPLALLVRYADGSSDEARTSVQVDPFGYTYENVGGQQLRLAGALVQLETCAFAGACIRWEGERFGQQNPQITGKTGEYAFLVVPGMYRLAVTKEGYIGYNAAITVENGILDLPVALRRVGSADILWNAVRSQAHKPETGLLLLSIPLLMFTVLILMRNPAKLRSARPLEGERLLKDPSANSGQDH
jgi:hypothetical protein